MQKLTVPFRYTMMLVVPLLAVSRAGADVAVPRHGPVQAPGAGTRLEGGFTASLQAASDDRIEPEGFVSADLVFSLPAGPGVWTLYIEGNTTPRSGGVSNVLGEANADAGTALDGNGEGRLQISELHYAFTFGADNQLCLGVIDPTGPLDNSEVANDETGQFIGASFVNNPTIEFPDYTLGACFHHGTAGRTPGIKAVVAGSNGLSDNPSSSYAQLMDVDLNKKGVFAAVETYWQPFTRHVTTVRLGTWVHTADHERIDGSPEEAHNYGVYALADGRLGRGMWNLRLGWANEAVSRAANFAGVAVQYPVGNSTVGFGLARTGASSKLGAGADDVMQAEVYARFDIGRGFHLTPNVQFIRNSGFDGSGTDYDSDMVVAGVRLGYAF